MQIKRNKTKPCFPPLRKDATVQAFVEQHGELCARTILTGVQHLRYQAVLAAVAVLYLYDWRILAAGIGFVLSAFYVVGVGFRLVIVLLSLLRRPELVVKKQELKAQSDSELPVYTILIPLYREPEVLAKVVRAIDHLDYPHEKLDVKLLLEEDDSETVEFCREIEMPRCVEVIVVPHALPKTKPKACNHGLAAARGKYLVIYDAEDRPDRDQLRKSVAAFERVPDEVVCLQAKLNYYNPDQNALTKWFTLEYSALFDLILPGLHHLGMPIPLGGTSNHFRTAVLREIGGWDPFNLTEDCDLGMRLHRHGWRTMVLDSTTWEEANSRLGNWMRQRSRWVKGFIQTHLVHSRSNFRTARDMGPLGFVSFLLMVGGFSASCLLNPFFWIADLFHLAVLAGLPVSPWAIVYSDSVANLPSGGASFGSYVWHFVLYAAALYSANSFFILIQVLGCARRRLWHLLPYALASPVYWALISIAGWKGFLQLFTKPFYWEKTKHGLTNLDPERDGFVEPTQASPLQAARSRGTEL
jgi:cellulose synthase/poly-beta-1,6-N-acetylglucosamine synthase-like glycosyltransferase